MTIVDTYEKLSTALEWLHGQDMVAYDVESTGLNVRRDSIVGFGVSNGVSGCYFPVQRFNGEQLEDYGVGTEAIEHVLALLRGKKLLCWNASFDLRFTKNDFGVDLVPALHADVMLLKHTCDEEFPFGLKEVGVKIYGQEAVQEQTALKASIKANGGKPTEFYKASTEVLASYCVADCNLTFRLFRHYLRELERQSGL